MDATLDYIEKRGEQRIMKLYRLLANDERLNEWNEALKDNDVLVRLFEEYSLNKD